MKLASCLGGVSLLGAIFGATSALAGLQYQVQTDRDLTTIVVSGPFEHGDDLGLFLNHVKQSNPQAVTFHSPGGNVVKAMELGRLIRTLRLATLQPKSMDCMSACSLAFMGGVVRFADSGAIGVHKASFSGAEIESADAVSAVQHLTAETVGYMIEMGVNPALLQLSLKYDSDDMRFLSKREMAEYNVTFSPPPQQQTAAAQPPPPQNAPAQEQAERAAVPLREQQEQAPQQPQTAAVEAPPPPSQIESLLTVPEARSGRVRHPKGAAGLKPNQSDKSASIMSLPNGTQVQILENLGRWFRVSIGGQTGYMHHTWLYVDQFDSGTFLHRHIQVKSFDNLAETEKYIRSAPIDLVAYLASNGWFAITLARTYEDAVALDTVKGLKAQGLIPDDAFMTYGNTYVRVVCCGKGT